MENLYEKFKSAQEMVLIAGTCVIENEDITFEVAEKLIQITDKVGINLIFKASFDKANRTSLDSYRGPGLQKGLEILNEVKNRYSVPIITDIHEAWQAKEVAEVVDIIQIPAFLCRQTDLLVASAKTGKIVNIKKAQFLSGSDMINAVKKVENSGNTKIILTERGTMFGYNNLVVDFRNMLQMKELGYPICYDATHSLQRPSAVGTASGGDREYILSLMKAMAGMGVSNYFMEVHPNPEKALSDKATSYYLSHLEDGLKEVKKIYDSTLL